MKSSELIKKLKKSGCYMVRHGKGSHEIWYSPKTKKEVSSQIILHRKWVKDYQKRF